MRLGMGLHLNRLGSALLSGSGVPSDALGNLGDLYLDTSTGRRYLKRWVGNFDGADSVSAPGPICANDCDWTIDIVAFFASASATYGSVLQFNMPSPLTGGLSVQRNGNANTIAFINPGVGAVLSTTAQVVNNAWHKLSFRKTAATREIVVDGVSASGSASSSVAPDAFVLGKGGNAQSVIGKVASLRVTSQVSNLLWGFSEGCGESVADATGNGNVGTVSDGSPASFWLLTWVPMDLL